MRNWTSDTVFIIGGGPTARSFDLSCANGKRLLLVNDAALTFPRNNAKPKSVAVFSLDRNWVGRNRDLLAQLKGERYVALPLESWPECGGISGVTYLRWSHERGLSDDPGVINVGCNSGYGALNLAYLKDASRIYLVGFDMYLQDNPEYYYWAGYFRDAAVQFKTKGVEVINLNPMSYIDAFPRQSVATLRKELEHEVRS